MLQLQNKVVNSYSIQITKKIGKCRMNKIQNLYNQHSLSSIAQTIPQLQGEIREQNFQQTVVEQFTTHEKAEGKAQLNRSFVECTGEVINSPPQNVPQKKLQTKMNTLTIILITMATSMLFAAVIGFGAYFILMRESNYNRSLQMKGTIADPRAKTQLMAEIPINENWVYFDEPVLVNRFSFQSLNEMIVPYKKIIPTQLNAKEIKLVIFYISGYSGQNNYYDFWIKTRTLIGNVQTAHVSFGHRYPQDAVSYNSEQFTIPCSQNREFRFKYNKLQLNGFLQYHIVAYRL